jgi:hypothetical protein
MAARRLCLHRFALVDAIVAFEFYPCALRSWERRRPAGILAGSLAATESVLASPARGRGAVFEIRG